MRLLKGDGCAVSRAISYREPVPPIRLRLLSALLELS